MELYTPAQFAKKVGVLVKTIQKWDRIGILSAKQTITNRRYHTEEDLAAALRLPRVQQERKTIAYCRVSRQVQKPALLNQRRVLEQWCEQQHIGVAERSKASFYLANDKFSVGDHWIEVPKLGRVNMAEQLRLTGKILSARISKSADWWFVSITVEMPDVVPHNQHPPVGIDVGLNRLATLSDGRRYENQRPLGHLLKKLRRLNKELARRTKGGKNWHKTKSKLARLHYRIACQRSDLLHKLTTEVARTSGLVAVEDLHVKGLLRNRCLSRSFSDAALGTLLALLESKVPQAGGVVVKVGRFYPSSQLCHCCGSRRADLRLEERIYRCANPACGYVGDRDENASCNIVQEALRVVGP